MNFDDIEWHDGSLLSCNISNEGGSHKLEITASIYENQDASDKVNITLSFDDVEKIVMTCDFLELSNNFNAGNINDGYRKGDSLYRLYLVDGYIEIDAKHLSISR